MRDQESAVGLRQHIGEIARAEPGVDRHQHRADLLDGEGDEDMEGYDQMEAQDVMQAMEEIEAMEHANRVRAA